MLKRGGNYVLFFIFIFYVVDFTVRDLYKSDVGPLFYFLFSIALKYDENLLILSNKYRRYYVQILNIHERWCESIEVLHTNHM